jgi:hypothetical protein
MTCKRNIVVTEKVDKDNAPAQKGELLPGRKTMVVIVEDGSGLAVRRVGWLDRFKSRIRATRLDHELAGGASPEASMALALRARALVQPAQGPRLAAALQRIMSAADPSSSVRLRVPVNREAVRAARPELQQLADRLRSEPMDAHTIARVRTLVTEGNSPLYRLGSSRDLRLEIADLPTTPFVG